MRERSLESGVTKGWLTECAIAVYAKALNPAETRELDTEIADPGMRVCVDYVVDLELQSEDQAIQLTVSDLAKTLRKLYRDTHQLPEREPEGREHVAWEHTARFLAAAAECDDTSEAAAALEIVMHKLQEETADVGAR